MAATHPLPQSTACQHSKTPCTAHTGYHAQQWLHLAHTTPCSDIMHSRACATGHHVKRHRQTHHAQLWPVPGLTRASVARLATSPAFVTSHTTPYICGPLLLLLFASLLPAAAAGCSRCCLEPPFLEMDPTAERPNPASSCLISLMDCATASGVLPVIRTESPWARNSRARAFPKPRVLPVTTMLSGDAGGRQRRALQ
jgi:hypothetical protein